MSEKKTGLAPLPANLLRPTTAPQPPANPTAAAPAAPAPATATAPATAPESPKPQAVVAEPADATRVIDPGETMDPNNETQPTTTAAAPKARKKRASTSTSAAPAPLEGENKGFKLYLPEDIHIRLKLLAIKKRKRVSAVAAEILDKALPRWRLEEEE